MIIETAKDGRVIAIAEDIEDVSQLVALRDLNRAHRAGAPIKKTTKGGTRLGHKHPLKQCRDCGRKVRYMASHIRHKHLNIGAASSLPGNLSANGSGSAPMSTIG